MSGSAEGRATETAASPGWHDAVLSWVTASRMIPLVCGIVRDVLEYQRHLARLRPEKSRLDRQKGRLAWPERSRRYQLQEEIASIERSLEAVRAELDSLGVALLQAGEGQVGFPTLVNDRRAFFSWRPNETNLQFWHFAGEDARRPIPAAWVKADMGRLLGPG